MERSSFFILMGNSLYTDVDGVLSAESSIIRKLGHQIPAEDCSLSTDFSW